MKLIYPACFYPNEHDGYTAVFPDLNGCATQGNSLAQAMDMAGELAAGWLIDALEEGESLPNPTPVVNVRPDDETGFVSLVLVDLDEYSKRFDTKAVKKTLTVPAWLNTAAERASVNFSQTLQDALYSKLGLTQQ